MQKTTKGAIAAGAAAVLLLGGAGSLAYWSDSTPLDGGSLTAGDLALSDAECDDWDTDLIVPGDVITKECTFTISATGDNLEATLTTPSTVTITPAPAAASWAATVSATYADQDDAALSATITDANDGDVVTATIVVTFPYGTAEDATCLLYTSDAADE